MRRSLCIHKIMAKTKVQKQNVIPFHKKNMNAYNPFQQYNLNFLQTSKI